ncbi:MAG: hypothetical protein CMI36_08750 [Owenweeksia sp.]|nr:hypothetical protein [Owenweeksia sp.]
MDKAYYEHYLGNCLRVSNIQRLFSEDIIIEFEKNPYEHRFAGFLRHRYTPEMGKDEYSMQRIEGTYTWDEEFTSLHINNLDNKAVDITIRYEDERELYNEISGSERDLALISTHYGNVQEFSFVRCK